MVLINALITLASLSMTWTMCKKKKNQWSERNRSLACRGGGNCQCSRKRPVKSEDDSSLKPPSSPYRATSPSPSPSPIPSRVTPGYRVRLLPEKHEKSDKEVSISYQDSMWEREKEDPTPKKPRIKRNIQPVYVDDNDKELEKAVNWRHDMSERTTTPTQKTKKPSQIPCTPSRSTAKTPSTMPKPAQSVIKTDKKKPTDKTTTDKPKDTPKSKERAKSKTKKTKREEKKSLKDSKRSKDQKKMEKVEKEEEIRVKLMDDPPGENDEEQSGTRLTELYSDQLKLTN